jgi:hypothetical protein
MTTTEIASQLAEHCRKGEFEAAQKKMYAQDAISIEPNDTPDFPKETKGLTGIIEKGHKFNSIVEKMHGLTVSEPLVTGNVIAFTLTMDITMKGHPRMDMAELCVYHVKDGKVVSEQFFM